ncbi:ProQ/FinO family protein [Pelomonas sp. SE-A7]|uniref:ProQ/FinO family protein n=1 Tax=Pelomonas sp. SE-A7 TaxID=3054953 RepID=UPI00259CF516|nr:ProQ/FinO family protein [Pelomonas sp. SE-A7]MDM4768250.1 ProQ/FinO family protein [Pelomonas sp. SE-A7]
MTETTPTPAAPENEEAQPKQGASAEASLSPTEVAAQLKALFPALFTGMQKPLKLRIQADIQERAPGKFTKAQLSAFLRRHTGSTGYLIGLSKATHRHDLDGNPVEELSDEHRQAAKAEVKRRREMQNEREALAEQQRFNRAQLLRDYQRNKLSEANFCTLKGIDPAELPGLLELAKKEAAERPAQPEQRSDAPRRDARPPRRDGDRKPGGAPTSAPKAGRRNASR